MRRSHLLVFVLIAPSANYYRGLFTSRRVNPPPCEKPYSDCASLCQNVETNNLNAHTPLRRSGVISR
jgi:hypothetical protein